LYRLFSLILEHPKWRVFKVASSMVSTLVGR